VRFPLTVRSLVSLLTPSFNRAGLISQTLDSVLAQSYPHWEMIVVDVGSTDLAKEIAAEYAMRDDRIMLFERSWKPKGACTCRNEGVSMSRGDYVMFLDTDDVLEPFCLENRVAAMDARPELDFAIFPGLMFEAAPFDLNLWWNVDKPTDELARQFRQDAICQGTGVLFRRNAFIALGMWDVELAIWQDIDLFFRAYIEGFRYAKFFDLPPDLHNRVSPTSISRYDFHAPEKTLSRIKVIKRAVALLKDNSLEDKVSEARFMTAEIYSGATRSRQYAKAAELLGWAENEGVFTSREASKLKILGAIYRSKLVRVTGFSQFAKRIEEQFEASSTLGILPYRAEHSPSGRARVAS